MPEYDVTFEHRTVHIVRATDDAAAIRAAREDLRVQLAVLGERALATSWTRVVNRGEPADDQYAETGGSTVTAAARRAGA